MASSKITFGAKKLLSVNNMNDAVPAQYRSLIFYTASSITNGPSGVEIGYGQTYMFDANNLVQILFGNDKNIYLRYRSWGTWSSWYKFTGTAL